MTAAESRIPAAQPHLLTVAEYLEIGEIPSGYSDLADPVSLLALHNAGELGYAVTGEFTGTLTLTEPARFTLDLDALL